MVALDKNYIILEQCRRQVEEQMVKGILTESECSELAFFLISLQAKARKSAIDKHMLKVA